MTALKSNSLFNLICVIRQSLDFCNIKNINPAFDIDNTFHFLCYFMKNFNFRNFKKLV